MSRTCPKCGSAFDPEESKFCGLHICTTCNEGFTDKDLVIYDLLRRLDKAEKELAEANATLAAIRESLRLHDGRNTV